MSCSDSTPRTALSRQVQPTECQNCMSIVSALGLRPLTQKLKDLDSGSFLGPKILIVWLNGEKLF